MMLAVLKRSSLIGKTDNIQVEKINYSIDEVKKEYENISKKITNLQISLDKHNQTYEFEVDI